MPVIWLSGSYPDKHSSRTVLRGLPTDPIGGDVLVGDGEHAVELGLDLYSSTAFRDGVSVSASVRADDVTTEQTVLDFAEAIRLDISRTKQGTFEFTLSDGDSETTVRWSDCESGERYFVEGKWSADDGTMALLVDGTSVASRSFDGPLQVAQPYGGWTLMKEGHLEGNGLHGELAEIRLYNRATTDAESAELAGVGR